MCVKRPYSFQWYVKGSAKSSIVKDVLRPKMEKNAQHVGSMGKIHHFDNKLSLNNNALTNC
jgi:hypothetical protein